MSRNKKRWLTSCFVSPRRGELFVTRKITLGVASIDAGYSDCLRLGNLDARRNWVCCASQNRPPSSCSAVQGHARDYVAGMHAMLQQPGPDDYVLATGESRTVREFCDAAFAAAGLGALVWAGAREQETGSTAGGAVVVRVDPGYYRPAEVDLLRSDSAKAQQALGFDPRATPFSDLVAEMVAADWEKLRIAMLMTAQRRSPPP